MIDLGRDYQVKLYDESENVLEIRMLKSDEVVKAGETLTFHSHIVDVGDCMGGDSKPSSNVKAENNMRNVAHSFGGVRPLKKKFRSPIAGKISLISTSLFRTNILLLIFSWSFLFTKSRIIRELQNKRGEA